MERVNGIRRLGHLPALDGLRGLAIAIVILYHYFHFPLGGQAGVDLFFALSGYLITTLLIEERQTTGCVSLRGFYVRRARRLFPALAALLLVYLVVDAAEGVDGLRNVALGGLYFSNFVQAFTNPDLLRYTGLDHLWSLAQEEQFYVVWPPLLLAVLRARRPVRWVLALLVLLLAYRTGLLLAGARLDRVYRGPDTHSVGLLSGCLLALRPIKSMPEWVPKLLCVCTGGLIAIAPFSRAWWLAGQPALELACVLLVAAAVCEPEFQQVISNRPLIALGKISYSLYLWHWTMWWLLRDHSPLIVPGAAFVAASLSYRFVEQPFRRRRPSPGPRPLPALDSS